MKKKWAVAIEQQCRTNNGLSQTSAQRAKIAMTLYSYINHSTDTTYLRNECDNWTTQFSTIVAMSEMDEN